jgi:immune inhibitor A
MSKIFEVNKALALGLMLTSCSFASIAGQTQINVRTPADSGVVNKERVLYWLIKHGDVSIDDTEEVKQAAVQAFIARSHSSQFKLPLLEAQAEKRRLNKAKMLSKVQASQAKYASQAVADSAVIKTVKVLGVLIDFPDLPNNANRLTAGDTDMYYPSYPQSHYKNLLFSTTGFTGPQSQNLKSGYQYFQAASGGSFFFNGDVKGWYTASNNAAYYGGNDADNDDSDKAVPELVKEAVTKAVAAMSTSELAGYDIEDPYDLDGDGNTDEPDGAIDHVMIFHSSIGEEAGGGVLKEDAIWSHRFFVDQGTNGYTIPGKGKKVFGYTIQPIDAATGVCTHEFGHDLGLPDEYDTSKDSDGSPVGLWSLMSGGSWVGSLAGTEPSGFSPYARSYLQDRYKGKWVNELSLTSDSLTNSGIDITLHSAVNADKVNQVSITLPPSPVPFKAPFSGRYQYHSGSGNLINNALSFDVSLPVSSPLTLSFKAHWNIEQDYDYVQVMADDVALQGNYTKSSNPQHSGVRHFISGTSSSIPAATGADSWVELTYDLSAYAGQSKRISFVYVTDEAEGDYGMAIDDIKLLDKTSPIYSDDAETIKAGVLLTGFSRIEDTIAGKDKRYLIQLRNHSGIDAGLKIEGYEPGVLLWLENYSYADNNVVDHPGFGLIGVVDADQDIIGNAETTSTDVQIRDAAFSQYNQKAYSGDNHLGGNSVFDDSLDYSAPSKLMAGMKLDKLGITMEVIDQASDSSQTIIRLKRTDGAPIEPTPLLVSFTAQVIDGKVSFSSNASGGKGSLQYAWNFGVVNANSTLLKPEYTYTDSGDYTVTLTVTDSAGTIVIASENVRVIIKPIASFTATKSNLVVSLQSTSTKGFGSLSYAWDFGDGSTLSLGATTNHTFAAAGTYGVKLTVTDSLGNIDAVTQNVTVTMAAPVVTPTVTPVAVADGGGGGSLGWLSCLGLALLAWRRKIA